MLITIKDYCQSQGISRQFVYKCIQNGKVRSVELPVFARYGDAEIEVGTERFLEIPLTENELRAKGWARKLTHNKKLQQKIAHLLAIENEAEADKYRAFLDAAYEKHPLKAEYESAMAKIYTVLMDDMKALQDSLRNLQL